MGVYPTSRRDGGDVITGGGDICLPHPEHSCTVYCNQTQYVYMYSSGATSGVKGGQVVVVSGRLELGGDANGRSGGGTDRGDEGDKRDRDGNRLNWWEGNVAKLILGTEPNNTLASSTGLELHHHIMSMLRGNEIRLERNRDTVTSLHQVHSPK